MTEIKDRKVQHIDIVLNQNVEPETNPFTNVKFEYRSLPDIDFKEINTKFKFMKWDIDFPFMISSMTGGIEYGQTINENIAKACERANIPFGLGSMRILKKNPETLETFNVKKYCPSVPMFGNLGLVQLNYGIDYDFILNLIEKTKIDGLIFHVNALQEAIQPEGDTNFKSVLDKFASLYPKLPVDVIVKEVGHGLDSSTIKDLLEIGVKWFDVSGVGGTSWAKVEGYRLGKEMDLDNLGNVYEDFGMTTPELLKELRKFENINLIAGGGIRSGLDIAKSLMLGAKMATSARPFLQRALNSEKEVFELLETYKRGLKIAMFMTNSKSLQDLKQVRVV